MLFYFGISFGVAGLFVLTASLVFRRPNHHNPAKWGTVHIHLADGPGGFSRLQTEQVRLILPELNRLGPTFVLGGNGENSIRVVNAVQTTGRTGDCRINGTARYMTNELTGESHIEIDPRCTHGNLEFRTALMHEVGHALGMQHICRIDEERDDCSPVGRGLAVMNPNLVYREDQATAGLIPTFEIQPLDIQEFERVARPGQRIINPIQVDAGL